MKKVKIFNCDFKEVPVELLEIGDHVVVHPGSTIPTDGIIVKGRGYCNESMLSGESKLIEKNPDSQVMGGTTTSIGLFIFKVEKRVEDATFN